MTIIDIWFHPWAMLDTNSVSYRVIGDDEFVVEVPNDCAPILVSDAAGGPRIEGKEGTCEFIGRVDQSRMAWMVPIPIKVGNPIPVTIGDRKIALHWLGLPQAPSVESVDDPESPDPSIRLMDRVKRIWTRLREMEEVIADPATMWHQLAQLWMSGESDNRPKMDEIVKQARHLPPVLERLDKSPRRVLRRVQHLMPLSRIQELDRSSMTWLIRQPGDTIAEQAGDRQRIRGVAREENYNTLENRVLVAYARLAREVADDYVPRGLKRVLRSRERLVETYGGRCKRLNADLAKLGIGEAKPDATPNFVLLNNANYRAVWDAWRRLLGRKDVFDELWRWQARSWEEFSALAVMIALHEIDGAEVVGSSPIIFRQEQQRGCWVQSCDPFGVVHLNKQGIIAEVSYSRPNRSKSGGSSSRGSLEELLAPVRIRCGRVGNGTEFLKTVVVWPLWSTTGGLVSGEVENLSARLQPHRVAAKQMSRVSGGIVVRPAQDDHVDRCTLDRASCLTIGASGTALKEGLTNLKETLRIHLNEAVKA